MQNFADPCEMTEQQIIDELEHIAQPPKSEMTGLLALRSGSLRNMLCIIDRARKPADEERHRFATNVAPETVS